MDSNGTNPSDGEAAQARGLSASALGAIANQVSDGFAAGAEGDRRVRQIADFLPQLVWTCTPEGLCDFLNRRWVEYTGLSEQEQLGTRWLEQVHPDDRAYTWAAWREAIGRDSEFRVHFRIRRHDGLHRWFDTRALPMRDVHGRILKWFGSSTDVHDEHETREQLDRERELIQKVAASVPGAIGALRMHPDGRVSYPFASAGISDLYGLSPDEIHVDGSNTLERIHPEDRERVLAAAEASASALAPLLIEYRVLHPDRGTLWVECRSVPTREADGSVRFDGVLLDVTARKRADQALRASERRYHDLVRLSPDAVIVNRSSRIAYANPAALELFGAREAADLLGTPAMDRFHPDFHDLIRERIQRIACGQSASMIDERIIRLDGEVRDVEVAAAPFEESDDEVAVQVVLRDVTERRRAEEALRDSQRRLLAALEASGLGTWVWDVETGRISWDEASWKLWGGPFFVSPAATGEEVLERVHPDDRDVLLRLRDELVGGEREHSDFELRVFRSDGTIRWIAGSGRVERDAADHALRLIGTCADVTERKRSEEARAVAQKLEALGTLAGGIAHDFNNILLAILGNAELIELDLPGDHPSHHAAIQIVQSSQRAADLVRRILAFGRPSAPRREPVRLQPLVDEALELVRATVPAMVRLHTRCDDSRAAVSADPTQLHQVVVNLVANAAQAIGTRSGQVEVELRTEQLSHGGDPALAELRPGRYVRLSVRDDGCGMDDEVAARIFDPFFTTKEVGRGTGLGLSVVHDIVKSHGGAVTFESAPNAGSTFHVLLPALEEVDSRGGLPPDEAPRGRGEHVLVVDDEEMVTSLTVRALERLGYRATGHTGAVAALRAFEAEPHAFAAVVTDLAMPDCSGFELAGALRRVRADVPILLMSGRFTDADRDAAERLRVHELIPKPESIRFLAKSLHRLLVPASIDTAR